MPRGLSGGTTLIYDETTDGLAYTATITGGVPPTTAATFAVGCKVTDLSTGLVYTNTGTSAAPVWTAEGTKTVALTAANMLAMYAAPVLVVAPIAGKAIIVDSVEFVIVRTATSFAAGGVVAVQYDSTVNGGGTLTHATIAAAVLTAAAGTTYTARVPAVAGLSDIATASITNIGLYISNATAAFTTGTGTATLTVRYHTV